MNILFYCNLFFLLYCLVQFVRGERKISPLIYIILLILIYLRSFVDIDSVSDLGYYEKMFVVVQQDDGFREYLMFSEPGFTILEKIVSYISVDFTIFLIIYNVFLFSSFVYVSRNFSIYPYLSLILFTLIAFNQSVYVLRQWFAISIYLFSYRYIIEKKQIKFLLLSVLAVSFHFTSIIFIPVYYIYHFINNKNCYVVFFFLTIIWFVMFGLVNQIVAGVSEKYTELYLGSPKGAPLTNFFIQLLFFITSLFIVKDKIWNSSLNKLIIIVSYLSVITTIAGIQILLVQRLALFYSIINVILIPQTTYYIKDKPIRFTYLTIVLLFLSIIYCMSFNLGFSEYCLK